MKKKLAVLLESENRRRHVYGNPVRSDFSERPGYDSQCSVSAQGKEIEIAQILPAAPGGTGIVFISNDSE